MFTVTFPEKQVSFDAPLSVYDAAREAGLISREVVGCAVNDVPVDLTHVLDGDASDVRTVAKTEPPADVTSFDYEGVIPRQRAGRKVTFRIRAITAYNVPSYTQLREYTVPDEEEEESEQPI